MSCGLKKRQDCLTKHYSILVENLHLKDSTILDKMVAKDIISWNEYKVLMAKPDELEIARTFLDIMRKTDSSRYEEFLKLLCQHQRHLAEILGAKDCEFWQEEPEKVNNGSHYNSDTNETTCTRTSGPKLRHNARNRSDYESKTSVVSSRSFTSSLIGDNIYEPIQNSKDKEEVLYHLSNPELNQLMEFLTINAVLQWIDKNKTVTAHEMRCMLKAMYFEWLSVGELQGLLEDYKNLAHQHYVILEETVIKSKEFIKRWQHTSGHGGKPCNTSNCARPRPGSPYILCVEEGSPKFALMLLTASHDSPVRSTLREYRANQQETYDIIEDLKPPGSGCPYSVQIVSDPQGNIYIIGGAWTPIPSKTACYKLHASTLVWEKLMSLAEGRYGHLTCLVDNKIFAIGGLTNMKTSLRSVEIYDMKTGLWKPGTPFPVNISLGAAVSYKGSCIVAGGIAEGLKPSTAIYRFHQEICQWELLSEMFEPRYKHAMCTVNEATGPIYIIGGEDTSTVEVFDPETKQSFKLDCAPKVHQAIAIVYNDCIFITDRSCNELDHVFHIYDTTTKSWNHTTQVLPINPQKRNQLFWFALMYL